VSALVIGFQERLDEVESYLAFLSTMEDCAQRGPPCLEGSEHPISVQQQRILYSSVYLQLYNLIEATMSRCIEAVTMSAQENGQWKPGDLVAQLRQEWVRSIARTHESNLTPVSRLEHALKMCDHLVASLPIADFDIDKGGGGNWDDDAIEAISRRLGFQLTVSQPVYSAVKRRFQDDLGPLALVKSLRNRLAHGSISFAQCAENVTVASLIDLKDKTVAYLREVVGCFVNYIEIHEYLIPERRPV
jgi:hypothetical protein